MTAVMIVVSPITAVHQSTSAMNLSLVGAIVFASCFAAVVEHAPLLMANPSTSDVQHRLEYCAPAAPWTPIRVQVPQNPRVALIETALVLWKYMAFLGFAYHFSDLRLGDDLASTLSMVSRIFMVFHVMLCVALGVGVGATMVTLPNLFPDIGPGSSTNPLAVHMMFLGGFIGALDVGFRGLRRGDQVMDHCLFAGIGAGCRLVAAVLLDLPHTVIGLTALLSRPVSGDESCMLATTVVLASMLGLALAVKVSFIDCRWFGFGSQYRQRCAYLQRKYLTTARWTRLNARIRQMRRETNAIKHPTLEVQNLQPDA